jgi:hypothetical protein
MEDRVIALNIPDADISDVFDRFRYRLRVLAKGASRKDIAIQAVHLVPRIEQHGRKNRSNIAFVSRE